MLAEFVKVNALEFSYFLQSTPRCHPNCKSKVVLDSICTSCHAIQECLKTDENFEKYFEEEEFETSHWPCEKCLEALKSIKMFWRIISERIFNITIPKSDDFESSCGSNASIQDLTKAWQKELVQQALIVRNLTPLLNNELKPTYKLKSYTKYLKNKIKLDNILYKLEEGDEDDEGPFTIGKLDVIECICKDKATETNNSDTRKRHSKHSLHKKVSKCTSMKVKTVDFGGGTCNVDVEEINMYKNNLDYLQQRYNLQNDELRQLRSENVALELQLQNMKRRYVEVPSYSPTTICDHCATVIPKPYELNCDKEDNVKEIDSEMIITLKNCENENFKHVSMLQVLHKTNGSIMNDSFNEKCCRKNEDPVEILTKVHNQFGAIVRRELTIANEQQKQKKRNSREKTGNIPLSKVHTSKSVPSCSTVSCRSSTSDMAFVSTTEV